MALFRLIIEGRNYPGFLFERPETPYGFFTTRWIEAPTRAEAEQTALRSVRWEFEDLLPKRKAGAEKPSLHLLEVEQVATFPEDAPSMGATWYPMDAQ
jgi:hypothetical protein